METRVRFVVENWYHVYSKDDPEHLDPIDTDYDILKSCKTKAEAERHAKWYSECHKLEFPLRVCERHESRDPPPAGHVYKPGMGWHLDHEATPDDDILSEWWEGKKQV